MSPYAPRHCGAAAYTHDLAAAVGDREVVAILAPEPAGSPSPGVKAPKTPTQIEIHHRIRRDDPGDHEQAARDLARCADVVSIQFEPGTWGGEDGSHVLDFIRALEVPAVVTLHAPVQEPSPRQRAIVEELVSRSAAAIALSDPAAMLLVDAYDVDATCVHVIPHGVLDLPLVDSATMKPTLELGGRQVILGFGLLGPGKGVELALEALPAIVAAHPDAVYVVVGATHADLVESGGDAYRASLVKRVAALGLGRHVLFVDRFVGRVELTRWLEAADVFLAPYPDLGKTASGTIAYAMGAGRAVVSTPSAFAIDALAEGRGLVTATASPADLAAAVVDLLGDDERRAAIGRRAYDHAHPMTWSAVGAAHRDLFARVAAAAPPRVVATPGSAPTRRPPAPDAAVRG